MKGRKELFGPSSEASLPEEYALLIKENKLIFLILASSIFLSSTTDTDARFSAGFGLLQTKLARNIAEHLSVVSSSRLQLLHRHYTKRAVQ